MRDPLRDVDIEGYRLQTFDMGQTISRGKARLAYTLTAPDGSVIFDGDDFGCSPQHAIDSDEALRALLGFLTLKPGDTDREYFESYTPEQMAFARGDAERLSIYAMDPRDMGNADANLVWSDGDGAVTFPDWEAIS